MVFEIRTMAEGERSLIWMNDITVQKWGCDLQLWSSSTTIIFPLRAILTRPQYPNDQFQYPNSCREFWSISSPRNVNKVFWDCSYSLLLMDYWRPLAFTAGSDMICWACVWNRWTAGLSAYGIKSWKKIWTFCTAFWWGLMCIFAYIARSFL